MRPLSQLAAALARRGRGACGPGCAPPHAAHIAGSAARPSSGAALLRRSGAAPAGRGAARTVAAAPPRRAGCKLWWRPRGAVSASAPGSPLYRVSAPPPAPHTPPPAAAAGPPLPERAAAGRAPARRLCLARAARAPHRLRSGPADRLWSWGSDSPRRSARPARSGSGAPFSGLSLPAPVHFAGSSGNPPGSEACGRSRVRTVGWLDFGKSNFPVRKRRRPRGSSPPCVLLPSAVPRSPHPRSPPTPERLPRPLPPPRLHGSAPACQGIPTTDGFLSPGEGGDSGT